MIHRVRSNDVQLELPFVGDLYCYQVSEQVEIYPVETVTDLGVMVSSNCSWSSYIHEVRLGQHLLHPGCSQLSGLVKNRFY